MSEKRAGRRLLTVQEQDAQIPDEKQVVEAGAQSRLRTSGYRQLYLVSCEFHEGVLTLRGHVPTFHLKQIAQTLIRNLDGVEEINNRLEVVAPPNDRGENRDHAAIP
jgi:osmotically-inducible protein OsmY